MENLALTTLAERFFRQPSTDCVVWLLLTLMQINNGKCKLDKEIENVQFAEKRNTRSVIRAKSSAHGIQKLKKSLRLKGIKGW